MWHPQLTGKPAKPPKPAKLAVSVVRQVLDSCSAKPLEWRRLLYSLSFFHAVVQVGGQGERCVHALRVWGAAFIKGIFGAADPLEASTLKRCTPGRMRCKLGVHAAPCHTSPVHRCSSLA